MKRIAKKAVATVLGYQVRKLAKKNNFKVVAVVGSIGKTSTKFAIAQTLEAGLRVCYQEGNYNDIVSVPLVFFNQPIPSLFNPIAWIGTFWRNRQQLGRQYSYDVVVIELGSDAPGQIIRFKKYLKVDIAVLTAITPEHMLTFGTLDSVAKEELAVSTMSSLVLANKDLCDPKYLKDLRSLELYDANVDGLPKSLGQAERYSRAAAVVVAQKLGLNREQISTGLKKISPVPGRLQHLAGINSSTIIDDTYNASPDAVKLALKTLYDTPATQRIAVLGNMNELGVTSGQAHTEIGQLCDPKKLDLVITIGPDANKYLASAAEAKGCKVQQFDNPYTVGEYLKPVIQKGAMVLAKGSQNGVFAEEAVKQILADPKDEAKLVRQSPDWLIIKKKAFKK